MNMQSEIYKLTFNQFTNNYKLIFKRVDSNDFCEIDVLSYDAKNIALSKENIISPRLKTYDLLVNVFTMLSIKIDTVLISKNNNYIISKIILLLDNKKIFIDANFIDAIILSLKNHSMIMIHESLYTKGKEIIYSNDRSIFRTATRGIMSKVDKIRRLRKTMDELVENEKFESAAIVRDQIKKITKYKEN